MNKVVLLDAITERLARDKWSYDRYRFMYYRESGSVDGRKTYDEIPAPDRDAENFKLEIYKFLHTFMAASNKKSIDELEALLFSIMASINKNNEEYIPSKLNWFFDEIEEA